MGDKKTQTNTTSDNTATTTPNVPQWGADSLQNLNGSIEQLAGTDPQSFVTGPTALQDQAATEAGTLGGQSGADDSSASGMFNGVAANPIKASSLLTNLGSYMDPYTDDVVNTTLAGMKQGQAQTAAQQEAAGAAAGAFGGSRFGVLQGTTAAQNDLNNAQEEATLRDQAFNTGAGLSNDDATRSQAADTTNTANKLTAGQDLGSLATSENTNQINDINAQDALGQEQRSIAQSKATAPISLDQTIASLLGSNQLGLLTGSTTTGNASSNSTQDVSDPMGAIGGILGGIGSAATGAAGLSNAGGLAALFSDRRLKRDVRALGDLANGRRLVSWRYLWELPVAIRHVGFIAQDLLRTDPHLVRVGPGGFLTVNYGAL